MAILEKIEKLSKKKRKIIFWSLIIILFFSLLIWYFQNLRQKLEEFEEFETQKLMEELKLPVLREAFRERLKKFPKEEILDQEEIQKKIEELKKQLEEIEKSAPSSYKLNL